MIVGMALQPLLELVDDEQNLRSAPGCHVIADDGRRLVEPAVRRAASGISRRKCGEQVGLGPGGRRFDIDRPDVRSEVAEATRP